MRKHGELWRLELLRTEPPPPLKTPGGSCVGGGGAGGIRFCNDCCLFELTVKEQFSMCLIVLRSWRSAIGSDRTAAIGRVIGVDDFGGCCKSQSGSASKSSASAGSWGRRWWRPPIAAAAAAFTDDSEEERGVVAVDEVERFKVADGALSREAAGAAEPTLALLRLFFLSLCQLVSSWDTKVFSLSKY